MIIIYHLCIYLIFLHSCLSQLNFKESEVQQAEAVAAPAAEQEIIGVDSDYLKIYLGPTSLSGMPNDVGVFAKHKISKGEIICEFRGK